MNEIEKIGMYSTDEILEFMTEGEGRGFLGRSMFDAMYFKIKNLQSKIDKAVELNENIRKKLLTCCSYEKDKVEDLLFEQLDILKEDKILEIPQFKGTMEQLDNLCDIKKE